MHNRPRSNLVRTLMFSSEHAERDADGTFRFTLSPAMNHMVSYYIGKVVWSPSTQVPPVPMPRQIVMRSEALGRMAAQAHRQTVATGAHRNPSADCAILHQTHTGVYIANEPLGQNQWLSMAPRAVHSIDFQFVNHGVVLGNQAVVGPVTGYNYEGTWSPVGEVSQSGSAYDYEYEVSNDTYYLNESGINGVVQFSPWEGWEQLREFSGNYYHNAEAATYVWTDNGNGTGQSDGAHYWTFDASNGQVSFDNFIFAGTVYGDFASSTFTWTATDAYSGTISGGHSYSYDGTYVTVLWTNDAAQWYKLEVNDDSPEQLLAVSDYNDIWSPGTVIWTHQGVGFRTSHTCDVDLNGANQIRFQEGNIVIWREGSSTGTGDPVGQTTLYDEQTGTYDGTKITYADSSIWTGTAASEHGPPDATLAPVQFHAEVHVRMRK